MRAINIPMESFQPCGHTVHHFLEPNYYTSHADDVYNGLMENTPFISREVLLMTQSEFDAWFTNVDSATCQSNIGRKVVNVAIDLLPDGIVNLYCQDVANNLPNDQGMVFVGNLNLYYTMAELNAMGFWANIKAKAIALGRCTPPE
jgi:hypothetical protein